MDKQQLIDWIQLINSDNVGPVTFYKLLAKHGSAAEALQVLSTKQTLFSRSEAEYQLEKAERNGIHVLTQTDSAYPENLHQLNDAPPVLFVKGRVDILNYPAAVSIVGSRNASVGGRKIAAKIACDLTENDVLVISGMARGIDSAAHKGAMYAKNQRGLTVAVLGTGADVPYPTENTALYEQICEQGAVVSEFLPGTKPQANNFPRRNRLVSALSAGTLVVEASLNSGSLITARMALEQGKDIFAVPGSPYEGRSTGCNKLIREGAVLTESAEDILEVLRFTQNRQIKAYQTADLFINTLDKPQKNADSSPQKKVAPDLPLVSFIPENGIDIDELIRLSGEDAAQAMIKITELELDGVIERINGNTLILSTDRKI